MLELLSGLAVLPPWLYVLVVSMLPIVELRGAIPLGAALDLHWLTVSVLSVVGNMLPIPFILLFIRRFLSYLQKTRFSKLAMWLESRGQSGAEKVKKYELLGLALFVAIPLPGTGAWTGALIAALLNMKFKPSLISIFCGVLIAAVLVTLATQGIVTFLGISGGTIEYGPA